MIARKIENAVKTLGNIKRHVEPPVWIMVNRALNVLLEEAAKVRALEKKERLAASGTLSGAQKIDPAEISELLENIAATLRQDRSHAGQPTLPHKAAAGVSNP